MSNEAKDKSYVIPSGKLDNTERNRVRFLTYHHLGLVMNSPEKPYPHPVPGSLSDPRFVLNYFLLIILLSLSISFLTFLHLNYYPSVCWSVFVHISFSSLFYFLSFWQFLSNHWIIELIEILTLLICSNLYLHVNDNHKMITVWRWHPSNCIRLLLIKHKI